MPSIYSDICYPLAPSSQLPPPPPPPRPESRTVLFLLLLNIAMAKYSNKKTKLKGKLSKFMAQAYGAPGRKPNPRIRSGCPLLNLFPWHPAFAFCTQVSCILPCAITLRQVLVLSIIQSVNASVSQFGYTVTYFYVLKSC